MRWLRVDEQDVSNMIGANPDVIKGIPVVKYRKKGAISSFSPPTNESRTQIQKQQPQEIAQPSSGPHTPRGSPIPPPKPARLSSSMTSPRPPKPTRAGSGPPKPQRTSLVTSPVSLHIPSFSPTITGVGENEIELDEDDALCVICLNRYIDGENLRRLYCQHHFHKKV
jgi:hypothetical protein